MTVIDLCNDFVQRHRPSTGERQHFRVAAGWTAQRTPLKPQGEASPRSLGLGARNDLGHGQDHAILTHPGWPSFPSTMMSRSRNMRMTSTLVSRWRVTSLTVYSDDPFASA